jgi:Ca2+-binding RTX toxin-like protein
MSVDLAGGANALSLANGANTGTVKDIGTLLGGTGADTITLGTTAANASIDLGAGNDVLTFGNFANTATVANTEIITGGTGNDTVTLGGALTNAMSVDLGGGSNKLTLAGTGNTGTVSNVQTVIGGSGTDAVTLGTALVNGSVDLGSGSDTLQLANFTNLVSVANTETTFGGSGNDTVILTGSNASMFVGSAGMNFITGNSAADQFVLDQNSAGNYSTVQNFSSAKGDKIALDTTASAILPTNTYDLGGAGLVDGTNLKAVADAATRLTINEATGGKGGFVYQQNTGELYYSGNGSFTGGGTLIGVIDSTTNVPWTYSASNFTQV